MDALVYVAKDESIDRERTPFGWYVELVLSGIREHGLPREHGTVVECFATTHDLDIARRSRALAFAGAPLR